MEYAQTRMQARHGSRPDASQWRQLSEQREFAAYLSTAHALPCGSWLAGIDEAAGPHQLEHALRRHWRDTVDELTGWMPEAWHPALRWTAPLIDWPLFCLLLTGDTPPHWLNKKISDAAFVPPAEASQGLAGWTAEWVHRWPDAAEEERQSLHKLQQRVQKHLAEFAKLDPASAWESRRQFEQQLSYAFRRTAMRPTAAFIYLLLHALDLERLRADLLARALQRRRAS